MPGKHVLMKQLLMNNRTCLMALPVQGGTMCGMVLININVGTLQKLIIISLQTSRHFVDRERGELFLLASLAKQCGSID
jgi:hypothetical protein